MFEGRLRKGSILVVLSTFLFAGLFVLSGILIQNSNWVPYVSSNEWIQNFEIYGDIGGRVIVECENGDVIIGCDHNYYGASLMRVTSLARIRKGLQKGLLKTFVIERDFMRMH